MQNPIPGAGSPTSGAGQEALRPACSPVAVLCLRHHFPQLTHDQRMGSQAPQGRAEMPTVILAVLVGPNHSETPVLTASPLLSA